MKQKIYSQHISLYMLTTEKKMKCTGNSRYQTSTTQSHHTACTRAYVCFKHLIGANTMVTRAMFEKQGENVFRKSHSFVFPLQKAHLRFRKESQNRISHLFRLLRFALCISFVPILTVCEACISDPIHFNHFYLCRCFTTTLKLYPSYYRLHDYFNHHNIEVLIVGLYCRHDEHGTSTDFSSFFPYEHFISLFEYVVRTNELYSIDSFSLYNNISYYSKM